MSDIKIYIKKGQTNYKEKKLIRDLEAVIIQRQRENPEFVFEPVRSFSELQSAHASLLSEDVPFEEIEENAQDKIQDEKLKSDVKSDQQPDKNQNMSSTESSSSKEFVDPFNRDQVIVRDYVLGIGKDDYPKDQVSSDKPINNFDEPESEAEAFTFPDSESEQQSSNKSKPSSPETSKPKVSEPINPAFDEMTQKKKARSTKRFASGIVNVVVQLIQTGFVWYATKDISEAKLIEYEATGEMDLSILVELEEGQEITVKQFFLNQCKSAEEYSKISDQEKEDLINSLSEVLMEKGFAPTPMQALAMDAAQIIIGKGALLLALSSQTNSLLEQLRSMKSGEYSSQSNDDFEDQQYEPPQESSNQSSSQFTPADDNVMDEEASETGLIGQSVVTKE